MVMTYMTGKPRLVKVGASRLMGNIGEIATVYIVYLSMAEGMNGNRHMASLVYIGVCSLRENYRCMWLFPQKCGASACLTLLSETVIVGVL